MKILKEIPYYRLCGLTEWRMVKGHPRYSVSCNGEVLCWNWHEYGEPKICKSQKNRYGYLQIKIDGKLNSVHRIVCEAFHPNQQNKPCVDHVNTIRNDNRAENLQWTTYKENCNNPLTMNKHPIRGKFGYRNKRSIQIVQLTNNGAFVKKWSCGWEVNRVLGINQGNISNCCRGRQKIAGGFKWMYYSDWLKSQKKKPQDIKPLF